MDANDLRPQARDLFGQIPVSIRDLRLWLWSVPVWFRYTSRPSAVEAYLRGYDVAGKVARAKAEGRLGDVFGDERCPHCGAMFESGTEARLDDLERENAELRALLGRPRAAVVPLNACRSPGPSPDHDSAHLRLPLPMRRLAPGR